MMRDRNIFVIFSFCCLVTLILVSLKPSDEEQIIGQLSRLAEVLEIPNAAGPVEKKSRAKEFAHLFSKSKVSVDIKSKFREPLVLGSHSQLQQKTAQLLKLLKSLHVQFPDPKLIFSGDHDSAHLETVALLKTNPKGPTVKVPLSFLFQKDSKGDWKISELKTLEGSEPEL